MAVDIQLAMNGRFEMQTTEARPTGPETARAAGIGWTELLFWSALGVAAAMIGGMVVFGEFIPPLLIFAAPFVIGALIIRRRRKGGAIFLGVVGVLTLLLNLPFIVPSLRVPASTEDFIMTSVILVFLVVLLSAAVAAVRTKESGPSPAARTLGFAALALIGLSIATAAAARVTHESAVVQAGDIEIVTQDIEFSHEHITAEAGEVSVFVENKDTTLHTFTIEELGVDLQIPSNSAQRITFDAPSGTYDFECTPHSDGMKGTIEFQ
jgi:plastocyanin